MRRLDEIHKASLQFAKAPIFFVSILGRNEVPILPQVLSPILLSDMLVRAQQATARQA